MCWPLALSLSVNPQGQWGFPGELPWMRKLRFEGARLDLE